jgi:3-keto-disaccharide hydrolase
VVLFDGKSLDAFTVQNPNPNRPIRWVVEDGIATNPTFGDNLVSKEKFKDFKIEAEYKLAPKSNSGIYLRGRYELQLLDDLNDTTTRADLSHMAIYGRTPPSVKASKAAGEWQTMTAVVVGNRVTVTLNGTRVHDNAVIEGITGGALDNDELAPGPILIQGDHSQVWLKRVVVTPIK